MVRWRGLYDVRSWTNRPGRDWTVCQSWELARLANDHWPLTTFLLVTCHSSLLQSPTESENSQIFPVPQLCDIGDLSEVVAEVFDGVIDGMEAGDVEALDSDSIDE